MVKVRIPFGEWLPDHPDLGNTGLIQCQNVYPTVSGYIPVGTPAVYSNALDGYCRGYFSCFDPSKSAASFAGTQDKLYSLSGNTFGDVSKGGGYNLAAGEWWNFALFGNSLFATSYGIAPQVWTLGTSSAFADLGGSPPKGRYVACSQGFVMIGYNYEGTTLYRQRCRWCDLENPASWSTGGASLADFQDFADGVGDVTGIVGGEWFTIFQDKTIWRGQFVGGATIFNFAKIGTNKGTRIPGSIAIVGQQIFFIDEDGFYVTDGNSVQPVETGKADKFFWNDVNRSQLNLVRAAVDPINHLIIWQYVSKFNASATPFCDRMLVFNYQQGRWSQIVTGAESEYIAQGKTAAWTLDGLDSLFSSIDAVTPSLDDPQWMGGNIQTVVFDTSHRLNYLTGVPLAATFETGESNLCALAEHPNAEGRAIVTGAWPLVDGGAASVSIGARTTEAGSRTYSPISPQNATGRCPLRANGRYHTVKVTTAAGTTYNRAIGVNLEFEPAGYR